MPEAMEDERGVVTSRAQRQRRRRRRWSAPALPVSIWLHQLAKPVSARRLKKPVIRRHLVLETLTPGARCDIRPWTTATPFDPRTSKRGNGRRIRDPSRDPALFRASSRRVRFASLGRDIRFGTIESGDWDEARRALASCDRQRRRSCADITSLRPGVLSRSEAAVRSTAS